MKKVLLLLAAVVLVGCTKDELVPEVVKDCGCDRVVVAGYNEIVGSADPGGNPNSTRYYWYKTINECTGLQSDLINTVNYVEVGQCK